ncbi:unnamed protein product [Nippostrongylus brasiliensis]|uniref:SUI1 domain-containing protein n=1 Tax=Nippostrongylus brasiliensis TaxID=27835 RepID=A0A0N4XV26_NIPBR|nr:unnamed protein product [Nippostrongylus brasiliensis]
MAADSEPKDSVSPAVEDSGWQHVRDEATEPDDKPREPKSKSFILRADGLKVNVTYTAKDEMLKSLETELKKMGRPTCGPQWTVKERWTSAQLTFVPRLVDILRNIASIDTTILLNVISILIIIVPLYVTAILLTVITILIAIILLHVITILLNVVTVPQVVVIILISTIHLMIVTILTTTVPRDVTSSLLNSTATPTITVPQDVRTILLNVINIPISFILQKIATVPQDVTIPLIAIRTLSDFVRAAMITLAHS